MFRYIFLIYLITTLQGHKITDDLVSTSKSVENCNNNIEEQYENCKIMAKQKKFGVLPGRGWDNLQNIEMGRVLALNFSTCQFSQDNIYLLPNQVSLIPVKASNVELYSQLITEFHSYKSSTSESINIGGSLDLWGVSVGGSYSTEKQRVKGFQMQTKSWLSKVDLRYKVFQTIIEPDAPLDPVFKRRILDIAAVLTENNDQLYPKYLADLVVRDFGTHVIRTQDAGAILSKIDALNSEYVKKYESQSNSISVSASVSFNYFFKASFHTSSSSRSSQAQVDEYSKNCEKTHVDTHGGELFQTNFTINDWEKSVMDNLVVIDRNGDPIYYVLTSGSLPELNSKMIKKIYDLLEEAVHRYYERNIVAGCMDVKSPNFNEDANVDSGECDSPSLNFTLGGVYQTCTGPYEQCSSVIQINPLTGGYSCPRGYSSVKLEEGSNTCITKCHRYRLFWKRCETECSSFTTYWCYPLKVGTHRNGYQFGGFISPNMKKCPRGFIQLKLGLTSYICVTNNNDYSPGAIPFGGLYSCTVGNPLTETEITARSSVSGLKSPMVNLVYWPKQCAKGYVAHILTIERGCQISYCSSTNSISLGASPPIQRPPFIDLNFAPNATQPLLFQTHEGTKFIKDDYGNWKDVNYLKNNHTIGVVVGSIFGSLLIAFVVSVFVMFYQRRYRRKIVQLKSTISDSDFLITVPSETYGAIGNESGTNV